MKAVLGIIVKTVETKETEKSWLGAPSGTGLADD